MTSSSVLRQGGCTHFFMTDSEKATTTSWFRSIVTFYRGCMVSEITRFYCKPDMTSSSVLSQGALHRFFTQVLLTESDREPGFIIMVHWHISRASDRFEGIRHFILAGNCPYRPILRVFRLTSSHSMASAPLANGHEQYSSCIGKLMHFIALNVANANT